MTTMSEFLEAWHKATLRRKYNFIQLKIDELHHHIDNLSIDLGKAVTKKCELELQLNKLERDNELS